MNKKILLIEDDKLIRKNTSQILQLGGYIVITAENGKAGVAAALEETPDLIICDIEMPELDGYGVLHLLSKNTKTSATPFIFLTARSERADFRKGMEMGAEDFITKPFDDIELLNAVETRFKKIDILKTEFAKGTQGANEFLNAAQETGKVEFDLNEDREIKILGKKQMIYREGLAPRCLYYVLKGIVKTYRTNEVGKELITAMYKSGDFIGFSALYEDMVYPDNAEVMEDAELMIIPKDEFMNAISRDMQIAARFIHLLTQDIAEKEKQLMDLAYNSLRKRVANGLLHVFDKFKKAPNDSPAIEISREDLAQVVGTARESLTRTLSDFKSEKLIDIIEGKIIILNQDKLRSLMN